MLNPSHCYCLQVNKPLVPTVDPSKPLQEQFPVSCGSKHRQKEDVSDGAVVADVDGSAIQSQAKEEVFAPPPAEVTLHLIQT